MYILGIGHDMWISGAALVRDGQVVAAICEERLNRLKKYQGFPSQAIDACLEIAGISMDDLDLVVTGWNPSWHMESPFSRVSGKTRWRPEYLYSIPNLLLPKAHKYPFGPIQQKFGDFKAPFLYIDHQIAHATEAFYLSNFDEAAIFTADGRGERSTAMLGIGGHEGIQSYDQVLYPHSLGLFYGMITQYLGFVPHNDEWKVMALASFGQVNNNPYYSALKNMIEVDANGIFKLDLTMCGYLHPDTYGSRFYTDNFVKAIGLAPRRKDEPIDASHHQLAHALQNVYEESMTSCLKALHARTGMDNLVMSGGCMMNSVYNGKVISLTPFKKLYVSSCPDDSGIPVGSALWGYYEYFKKKDRVDHKNNYWGPGYETTIEKTFNDFKIPCKKLDDPCRTGAELVAKGKIIGWFQGRMEFGQRALGNRSILADPRGTDTKDLVNLTIKYRESFRPFAPSILAEKTDAYFQIEKGGQVPYMERVCMFKDEVREKIPAVVHVDGSGRLQTVSKEANPKYYTLIREFEKITGVPIVLNTSFNLNGEPIVCSPVDAIRTFYSCGLDALILGDYMIDKS